MNEFVMLPAVLFLPWFLSLWAVARWKRYAEEGDPIPWTARIGIGGFILCAGIIAITAVRIFGPAEWYLLMILAWVALTWILYKRFIAY